jgi:5-methyltetrahydrofolate--homocysteine methyltransferase
MQLREYLAKTGIKLLDGGMGTQLGTFGLEGGGHQSVENPDKVEEVHKRYVSAGSKLLITNSLTMNRIYLETHNVNVDIQEVNRSACRIARQAAGDTCYVLGDMSSTGQMLQPYGTYTEKQFIDNFREQADYLVQGGVDGFIIETMFDLNEAVCAVKGIRAVSDLPVLALISFTTPKDGGKTMMGQGASQCAELLTEAGADGVGSNCGDLTPLEMADIVKVMKSAAGLPIAAEPNAGKPELIDGETVFNMGPEEFAEGVKACIENGAEIVGGCCGTSPDHIKALAATISG